MNAAAAPWPEFAAVITTIEVTHAAYAMPIENECGTACCACGHVALMFGEKPEPWLGGWNRDGVGGLKTWAPVGSPAHQFMSTLAEELGADMIGFEARYAEQGARALEGVFERGNFRRGEHSVSARTFANAWNAARKRHGYVVEVAR